MGDPNLSKAYLRKGKAYMAIGRAADAQSTYTTALIRDPSNAELKKERGLCEEVAQRLKLAKQCLEKKQYHQTWRQVELVEKSISQSADVTMIKIQALCGIGRYHEAYNVSTSLMRVNSRVPGLLFWRARSLYYMDQMDNAIKHMQEAMRMDPDNSEYRVEIQKWRGLEEKKQSGNKKFKDGEYLAAIECWSECLNVDPTHRSSNAKLLLNRATAYSKLRRHEETVADCTSALELDEKYIKAYSRRAESLRILDGKENLQRAFNDYEKAMEFDSEAAQGSYKQKLRAIQAEIKRAGRKDFYKIMGLQKDATEDEIRKTYKKLALKYHPDRQSSKSEEQRKAAETLFKGINEAYECLLDKEKRAKYDAGVDPEDLDNPNASAGGCRGAGGFSQEDLLRMFMSQQRGGGGRRGSPGMQFHFG